MKHLLMTTIAAVVLVGCGESQQPEPPTAKAPDISIYEAAKEGNIEAVKQHIAAGTDINQYAPNTESSALYIASLEGHYEIAKLLLGNEADVNLGITGVYGITISPLDISTSFGYDKISDLLRQNGGKHGSIIGAVEADNYEAAKDFIELEADLNVTDYKRQTAIYLVKSKEMAELLIENDIDINFRDIGFNTPLSYFQSKAKLAKKEEQKLLSEIADLLRKHGGKTGKEL